jgi:cobalt-zinc-cadmium efflux system protein
VLALPLLVSAVLSLVLNGIYVYLLHDDSHQSLSTRGIYLHGIMDLAMSASILLSALLVSFSDGIGQMRSPAFFLHS